MRPSHLLLVLFAGFALTVLLQSPGAHEPRSNGDGKPQRVVHKWNGTRQAPDQMTLRGRLVDSVGHPVGGVRLEDLLGGAVTRSDASGSFSLRVARDRCVRLRAAADDGRRAELAVLPSADVLTVVLRPARPWLDRPAKAAGKPYGGVGVLRNARGRTTITVCETRTIACADEGGNYRIPVPDSPFHLIAHDAEGGVVMSETIAPPRPNQRWMPLPELTLREGLGVSGYLKNEAGDPVVGAELVLSGQGEERRLSSGRGGSFGAKGLLSGDFVIEALPFSGEVGSRHEFRLDPGASPDLELTLRAEKPLRLQVEDAAGTPQQAVFVQVTVGGDSWSAGSTDASGRVVIRGLPAGECSFEAYRCREDAAGFESLQVLRYEQAAGRLVVR